MSRLGKIPQQDGAYRSLGLPWNQGEPRGELRTDLCDIRKLTQTSFDKNGVAESAAGARQGSLANTSFAGEEQNSRGAIQEL